jgi:hypothetical protein
MRKSKTQPLFYFALTLALAVRFYLQFLARPEWLGFWANFDGTHYIEMAQFGYQSNLTQVFFPFYPFLIRLVNFITQNRLWSGLIISHLSFIGFLYFFIKLGLLDYSKKTIRWALIFLILFPTSFFFFSLYTESLFLFLVAAVFYLSRQKKFWLASILVGLASITSLVGIFLLPVVLWEYWQTTKKPRFLTLTGLSLFSASGLIYHLNFLSRQFGHYSILIHSQPGTGIGQPVDKLVMPYQVIFRYLKMLTTISPQNQTYPVLAFEFFVSLSFIGLIIWALVKKFRSSYLLFLVPAFFLPTFTGSFSSMPRYALAAFPLFYLLGGLKSKPIKFLLTLIFISLLSWSFIRFSQGYWVS